jgi:AraC-like DNA-binding protein
MRQIAKFQRISDKANTRHYLMPRTPSLKPTPLGDVDSYTPSKQRPVRVRARSMPADTHFEPHAHPWAQLAYCATGIVQVTAVQVRQSMVTYIVPPSRAVWIAPGAQHHITVLEAAEFRTLYIHKSRTPQDWQGCRVIVVSALLREAVRSLDMPIHPSREEWLTNLTLDEITHADTQALGVPLPNSQTGDKRLRALCEAVMRAPGERATLAEWAHSIGASERTAARLFREELSLSYQQWRQQAILAHALPLLARGQPISAVASASGYASDSAFSAMFKAAMGQSPSHFQNKNSPVDPLNPVLSATA